MSVDRSQLVGKVPRSQPVSAKSDENEDILIECLAIDGVLGFGRTKAGYVFYLESNIAAEKLPQMIGSKSVQSRVTGPIELQADRKRL